MKYQVTVLKKGQINSQYTVVGFRSAVRSAMKRMAPEIEMHVVDRDKNCTVETQYLGNHGWSCNVYNEAEELLGYKVGRA